MHRFSSRSAESAGLTKRATEAPATVLHGTPRRPTKRNKVRTSDLSDAAENLCIILARQPSQVRSLERRSSQPCPSNLIDVSTPTGEEITIRHQEGHILVCDACCCGNTEKGFPPVPLETWKSEWKARSIRKRVHLTIAGCLGPCPLANVVLIIFRGACVWLQAVNSPRQVKQVYDYVESMISAGRHIPLPGQLEKLHFTRYDFDTKSCSPNDHIEEYSAPAER